MAPKDEINRKWFPVGSAVYFVRQRGNKKEVAYGLVEENYTREVCIQLLDFCERRRINGIPVNEFETPTHWQKLPKGWSWDTKLFELTHDELPEIAKRLSPTRPEDIIKAVQEGVLVPVKDIDYCWFGEDIDKALGWRIVRKYDRVGDRPPYNWFASVRFDQVYGTYEEAQAIVDAWDVALREQAEMSQLEWSVSQIDNNLDRWARAYSRSEEEKKRYREWIMELDNLEDVETRLYMGNIQWRYFGKKKWMNIEVGK